MEKKPSVDIVIPVYNEELEIEKMVRTLIRFLTENLKDFCWQIIIADNASTDSTLPHAQKLTKQYACVSVVHLDKKGRGRAVKFVWRKSKADIMAYMDVDLSTDLKHFPPLIRSLLRGYDIAIGSRNLPDSRVYGRSMLRTITSRGYILLIKCIFWIRFSDAQCGFKAVTGNITEKLIPKILDNAWFFDTELLILAEKFGYRIYEEPVTWVDNPGSTVRVWKTAQKDIEGLWRLLTTRPWENGRKIHVYG